MAVAGLTVSIGGVTLLATDVIDWAKLAVNGANVRQLATAVEIYYSVHGSYPKVSGGEALVGILKNEGIIKNTPLDPSVFIYEVERGGEEYELRALELPAEVPEVGGSDNI